MNVLTPWRRPEPKHSIDTTLRKALKQLLQPTPRPNHLPNLTRQLPQPPHLPSRIILKPLDPLISHGKPAHLRPQLQNYAQLLGEIYVWIAEKHVSALSVFPDVYEVSVLLD